MNDNTQPPLESAQAPAMSEKEAMALLARAQADPSMAEALSKLREESLVMLEEIVREINASLPAPDKKADVAQEQGCANGFLALKNMSRQRESAAQQRQELAQAMVMGAILNRNNAEWNPLDPATDKASTENLIFSLFQMPPSAAPAAE